MRTEWDAFDIAYGDQRIEVKSSAYLQTWEQRTLSSIAFGGLRGRRYHPRRCYDLNGPSSNAHVYVFCVQTAKDHGLLNVFHVAQWDFYVVKRSQLAARNHAGISPGAVAKLSDGAVPWSELRRGVERAAVGERVDDAPWWDEQSTSPIPADWRGAMGLS